MEPQLIIYGLYFGLIMLVTFLSALLSYKAGFRNGYDKAKKDLF